MKNKYLAFLLVIVMIFTSACSGNGKGQSKEVVKPTSKDDIPELTIIMSEADYGITGLGLYNYISQFQKAMGVKVNIEQYGAIANDAWLNEEYKAEYVKKASTKLYAKDGPELIFSDFTFMNAAIEQGAVIDVKDKIPNINKIYDGLVRDKIFYVPIGVKYAGIAISKQTFEDMNQKEAGYEYTSTEYYKLLDQWVAKTNAYFNINDYFRLYETLIYPYIERDSKNNNIMLNTSKIIEGIARLRQEMSSGKYRLIEGFTNQSYYNAMHEDDSEELKVAFGKNYYISSYVENILRAGEIATYTRSKNSVVLPGFADKPSGVRTMGFMVNKNGKNLELAYEFINGLLSNEEQLALFNGGNDKFYPVNKDIEADILKLEQDAVHDLKAMELKRYALSKLKEDQCQTEPYLDYKLNRLRQLIQKDMDKLILSDNPLEGEALKSELKKLEDRYNLWLNE